MDEAFEPWVKERLGDSRYLGLLVEDNNVVVAGAGAFFSDFPPHWRHAEATRAYVLNVYTEPEVRGQGLAKRLMACILEECRKRGVSIVVLHASPQGRPLYESMGFWRSDEMMTGLST
jgi:GNAT superfamily N-acetyltransferase